MAAEPRRETDVEDERGEPFSSLNTEPRGKSTQPHFLPVSQTPHIFPATRPRRKPSCATSNTLNIRVTVEYHFDLKSPG